MGFLCKLSEKVLFVHFCLIYSSDVKRVALSPPNHCEPKARFSGGKAVGA
jgi:hypothetical protein